MRKRRMRRRKRLRIAGEEEQGKEIKKEVETQTFMTVWIALPEVRLAQRKDFYFVTQHPPRHHRLTTAAKSL